MKAIVLAGGFGSRLKPLTDDCPKPLLKLAGIPMLDYTVAQLHAYGMDDITYTLSYRANDIIAFCSGYKDLRQSYVIERNPLGTCGGVKAASGDAGDTFIVTSGDALNNIDLSEMLRVHYQSEALVTMAVTEVSNPSLYGVVTKEGHRVTGFVEKPEDDRYGNLVNCGVYVLDKRALEYAPRETFFDFSRDLFPIILRKGRLSAYRHNGYWTDIGDIKSYYAANFDMCNGGFYQRIFNPAVQTLSYDAVTDSRIGVGTTVKGFLSNSILGHNIQIADTAVISGCVVLDNATVAGSHFGEVFGDTFSVHASSGFPVQIDKFSDKFLENSSN